MGHACWCKWCFLSDFFGIKWCDHFPKKKSSWLSSFSPLKLTIVGQKKNQTHPDIPYFLFFCPWHSHFLSIESPCYLHSTPVSTEPPQPGCQWCVPGSSPLRVIGFLSICQPHQQILGTCAVDFPPRAAEVLLLLVSLPGKKQDGVLGFWRSWWT